LPFSVRLYFYAGAASVRIVHSFIFDGDPQKDFIRGLSVRAGVPMTDEMYNRHVRFSGQNDGVWGEAVRSLTGLRRDAGKTAKDSQIAGRLVNAADISPTVTKGLNWIPAWSDFTLSQTTADGYAIRKRTLEGHAGDSRATGLAYVGGAGGGVALGMKDFWQRCPSRLDIRGAASDEASVTAWMWSPDAPPWTSAPSVRSGAWSLTPPRTKGWTSPMRTMNLAGTSPTALPARPSSPCGRWMRRRRVSALPPWPVMYRKAPS
jgi:hypothetical protein